MVYNSNYYTYEHADSHTIKLLTTAPRAVIINVSAELASLAPYDLTCWSAETYYSADEMPQLS